jgi:viroplasmin and RNaseH domain-containing protein
MPICFTDPEEPLYVTTVEDGLESDEAEDEEDDANSRVSASDFEGDLKDIPKRMLFGVEECGAIFSLPSDHGKLVRICGCKAAECNRDGHRTTRLTGDGLGKPGSYETVRSRKFVDGRLETWIPVEEYEADLQAAQVKQKSDLFEAAQFLKARSPASSKATSPTGSEEDAYATAFGKTEPWATREPLPSPMADERKPAFRTRERKPAPEKLHKAKPDTKPKHDSKDNVVSPEGRRSSGDIKEKESVVVATMMDLMAGVRDSLKEVAGGMQALQKGQMAAQNMATPKHEVPPGAVHIEPTVDGMRFMGGVHKFGTKQSAADCVRNERADAGEWYAVLKGKDGAIGVFDNYEEAKSLVYRISGAIWKKFRFYEDAWAYVQDHMDEHVEEEVGWYYGVANGKDRFNGVISDYPTAKSLVDKVSGATWKKFRSHDDAFTFVQEQRNDSRTKSRSPPRTFRGKREEERESPNRTRFSQEKEVPSNMVTPQDREKYLGSSRQKREEQGFPNIGAGTREGLRPPIELAGEDPSLKKEDEVWGIDVGAGERAVRDKLCPPGLPTNIQKGMVDSMVDAVATPGGSVGGTNEDVSGTDILGQAMEELVYQGRGGEDGGRKAELSWRQLKNTTLRKITDQEKLRKQIKTLVKLREKIPKRIVKACKNGLVRAGWTDPLLIEAWSQGGYLMRIGRDSMDYYLSLHQHLMGLASSEVPWSYVQVEIDHHVEELDLIRSSADSRFQCILCMYCYLRDGVSANWHSSSLQYKRNLDAMVICNTSPGGSSPLSCTKCQTTLHSGGRGNCPWRTLSDAAAKKKGVAVLNNWANGVCAPSTND